MNHLKFHNRKQIRNIIVQFVRRKGKHGQKYRDKKNKQIKIISQLLGDTATLHAM